MNCRLKTNQPETFAACTLDAYKFLNPYSEEFEYIVGTINVNFESTNLSNLNIIDNLVTSNTNNSYVVGGSFNNSSVVESLPINSNVPIMDIGNSGQNSGTSSSIFPQQNNNTTSISNIWMPMENVTTYNDFQLSHLNNPTLMMNSESTLSTNGFIQPIGLPRPSLNDSQAWNNTQENNNLWPNGYLS